MDALLLGRRDKKGRYLRFCVLVAVPYVIPGTCHLMSASHLASKGKHGRKRREGLFSLCIGDGMVMCVILYWARSCLFYFAGYRSYCSGTPPPCHPPPPLVDTIVVCSQQDRHSISGTGSKYTLGGAASS